MNSDIGVEPVAELRQQTRPLILVVEDEVMVRLAVSLFLRDADYLVIEAASADEAMRVMNATAAVALVFSDVTMPGSMDGYGLARWIAVNYPATKVLTTSARSPEPESAPVFIAKPYPFAALGKVIEALLEA
jgi:CheY-like chemotaxis protein